MYTTKLAIWGGCRIR